MIRRFLVSAALAVLSLGPADSSAGSRDKPAAAPRRPNIVVILADDHATSAISAYGSAINRTPAIDRLAAGGMTFDRALVPNALCAPARATILTGKYSHVHGMRSHMWPFDGDQVQIQKLLGSAGYQTAFFGKWHLESRPQGFDTWSVLSDDYEQGYYYDPAFRTPEGERRLKGYATDLVTDEALEWLRHRDAGRPFILFVWHKAPHRPWDPPLEALGRYRDVRFEKPPTFFDDYSGRASVVAQQTMRIDRDLNRRDLKLEPDDSVPPAVREAWRGAYEHDNAIVRELARGDDVAAVTDWKFRRYLQDYVRTVERLDDNVGRVLDALDDLNLAKDTVVVYGSDQGFFLGEHGWFDKRWFHEESIRMPLIVRWPGTTAPGSRMGAIVSQADLMPTLLAAARVPVPPEVQGRSLEPLLRGAPPADWRRSFYYHFWENPGAHAVPRHYAVVTDRYTLVHYYRTDEWELFDRATDPAETKNVYGDPQYRSTVAELKKELRRLQRELGDTDPEQELPLPDWWEPSIMAPGDGRVELQPATESRK